MNVNNAKVGWLRYAAENNYFTSKKIQFTTQKKNSVPKKIHLVQKKKKKKLMLKKMTLVPNRINLVLKKTIYCRKKI